MFCNHCGTQNKEDASFCVNCGAALQHTAGGQTPPQPQMQQPSPEQQVPPAPNYAPQYQQAPPPQGYNPYQGAQPSSNGMAIGSLVCGIIGILFCWIPFFNIVTLVASILGIVFGIKGKKQAELIGTGNGMAVAGLILGIISAIFSLLITGCTMACTGSLASYGNDYGIYEELFDSLYY